MSTWSKCFGGSAGLAPVGAFCAKLKIVTVQKKSAFLAKVRPCHQSGMYPPSSKSLAVLRLRRRSPLKGCTLFASWTSSVGQNTWSEESSVTFVAAFSCGLGHTTVLATTCTCEGREPIWRNRVAELFEPPENPSLCEREPYWQMLVGTRAAMSL